MNLCARLEELRGSLAGLSFGAEVDRLLDDVSAAAHRLVSEHAGLADELLNVYEQLGIVFEVTGKLPTVKRESEVVDLFLDSLRRSFGSEHVSVVWLDSAEGRSALEDDLKGTEWIAGLVEHARGSGSVVVEDAPPGKVPPEVATVMVGPVFAGSDFVCAIVRVRDHGMSKFCAGDMSLLESLTTFCGDLIRKHRMAREMREMSFAMVRALVNAVDQKDTYTSGHSLRVGYFATMLGRRLNLESEQLRMLQWAALLHDVGKIGVRDDVLKKEGKLTNEEFEHIKDHPTQSFCVVQEVPQLAGALDGVLYHHERFNGRGYPSGLAGEEIPLQARILQIADIFDALTSNRSYRKAYDWRKALAILNEEAGGTADPRLVPIFDELIHEQLDEDEHSWQALVARASAFKQDPDLDEASDEGGG